MNIAVTVWTENGEETVLYVDMTEYERDDEFAYYQGSLVLDMIPERCNDEAAKKMVGRHCNIHLPIAMAAKET